MDGAVLELPDFAAWSFRQQVGPAEVDRTAAAQWCGVLDQHNLLVVLQPLEDFFGLNQPTREVLLTARTVG
jgi:hypothetical protein